MVLHCSGNQPSTSADTGLISNWYSKLYVAVRWKGVISTSFHVCSGVRQGSTLSPSLSNVFSNLLIVRLRHLGLGCHVGWHFVGCILYADDIILLSASLTGLKHMLKCCYDVSCELSLKFNCSKSYCLFVGKGVKSATADLYLGPDSIQWSSRAKYLVGLSYHTGKKLTINTDFMKEKFFTALTVF